MLYAIFVLLMIVFFPLLSLFMGVGLMVVIAKYWWVIALFFVFTAILKYGRSVNEREEEALRRGREVPPKPRFTFSGESNLSNDSYILFLTKKFDIQKNDLLQKYVVGDKLYATLEDALEVCHQLYQAELEGFEKNNAALKKELLERKANMQRALIFLGVVLLAIVLYNFIANQKSATYGAYGKQEQYPEPQPSKNSSEHEMSNQEMCDHFLGEEGYDAERKKSLEESIKEYCPSGTLPYWKQPR